MSLRTAPIAAVLMIAAFYIAVIIAPSHHLTLLGTGTVAIIACWIIAARLGVNATAGREMLGIFLASVFVIAMPVAAQVPIPGGTAVAMGIGILAIEATWASHRFPVFPVQQPQSVFERVVTSILFGLGMAFLVALIATVPMALALFSGPTTRAEVLTAAPWIYGGYFLGGTAAGFLVGLLRPFSRWPLGTMLLGVLGGVCVYGAIGPAVELSSGEPQSLAEMAFIALACGVFVGPPAALAMRYDAHAARVFDEQKSV